MAVTDLWTMRDGSPSKRHGRGLRWQVRVTGHPTRSYRTKGAAEAHYRELLREGPAKPRCETYASDLIDRWVAGKAGLSAGGQGAVAAGAGHARKYWGDVLVTDIRTHEVQSWIAGLQVTRTLADESTVTRPAGRDSKVKALAALRGAMAVARELGIVEANPCDGVSVGRAVRRDPRFLTVAQLGKLAREAGPYAPMVWFLGTTGVRIGECRALDVGNVTKRGKAWRARVTKSKNGTARDVPVTAAVVAQLDLGDRHPEAPLFLSSRGGRIDVRSWRRNVFEPAAARAGMAGLHVHDLRHTAASLMIRSGATPKDVQNSLGHKSAAMTLDLYAGHWDDALDGVSSRMDAMLGGTVQPVALPVSG